MGHSWILVPDVNVWLTVARNLGPFTLEQVRARIGQANHHGPSFDVFDLFATVAREQLEGDSIRIWSGDHIEETALYKAIQPDDSSLPAERRGLGWTPAEAECIAELIEAMVDFTGGGFCNRVGTYGHPPLDYEDGRVLQTARMADYGNALCERVCVTYDRDFILHRKDDPLVRVMSPDSWCSEYASYRRKAAMRSMLSPDFLAGLQ